MRFLVDDLLGKRFDWNIQVNSRIETMDVRLVRVDPEAGMLWLESCDAPRTQTRMAVTVFEMQYLGGFFVEAARP